MSICSGSQFTRTLNGERVDVRDLVVVFDSLSCLDTPSVRAGALRAFRGVVAAG